MSSDSCACSKMLGRFARTNEVPFFPVLPHLWLRASLLCSRREFCKTNPREMGRTKNRSNNATTRRLNGRTRKREGRRESQPTVALNSSPTDSDEDFCVDLEVANLIWPPEGKRDCSQEGGTIDRQHRPVHSKVRCSCHAEVSKIKLCRYFSTGNSSTSNCDRCNLP